MNLVHNNIKVEWKHASWTAKSAPSISPYQLWPLRNLRTLSSKRMKFKLPRGQPSAPTRSEGLSKTAKLLYKYYRTTTSSIKQPFQTPPEKIRVKYDVFANKMKIHHILFGFSGGGAIFSRASPDESRLLYEIVVFIRGLRSQSRIIHQTVVMGKRE